MKKIFYEKVGRKYVPVYEYDQTLMDAFPKGTHIVMCYPGGQSTRYNVNPNYASMIAAGRLAEDAISKKLMEASEIRMQRKDRDRELTDEQRAAWNNLIKEFGDSAKQLEWASVREIAEAGVDAMQAEADKLMQNESVRKAYEHFQLICELSKTRETAD
jgi:t-SNARE complex subunit (syntaxin)